MRLEVFVGILTTTHGLACRLLDRVTEREMIGGTFLEVGKFVQSSKDLSKVESIPLIECKHVQYLGQ